MDHANRKAAHPLSHNHPPKQHLYAGTYGHDHSICLISMIRFHAFAIIHICWLLSFLFCTRKRGGCGCKRMNTVNFEQLFYTHSYICVIVMCPVLAFGPNVLLFQQHFRTARLWVCCFIGPWPDLPYLVLDRTAKPFYPPNL